MTQLINKVIIFSLVLLNGLLLLLVMKGDLDGSHLVYQSAINPKVGGPFESTNSTSRYLLTQAIVENGTFFLTKDQARASAPDVVYHQEKFFSIFTPGVSFLAIPFYMLGIVFGIPQLVGFLSVTVFALLNAFLVAVMAKRLGAPKFPALLAGLIFLFATNGLSYALTMAQHHMTVTVLLLAILLTLSKKSFVNALAFGALCGVGLLLDIPNIFFLLPVGIIYLLQHIGIETVASKIKVSLNTVIFVVFIGILPFLALFAWYNNETVGSPTRIAQSIGQTRFFDSAEEKKLKRVDENTKPLTQAELVPFKTRNELNSLYILFLSNERAWIFYSPVVLLGFVGLFLAYRRNETRTAAFLVVSVIAMNVTVYAMFGDPWGGWSFGPRYLIPSAALASSGIGYLLWRLRKNILFMTGFILVLLYSIAVSLLGALTTNAIPPKVEAINLPDPIPYTFDYNLKLLDLNQLSSLVYNSFFANVTSGGSYFLIVFAIAVLLFAVPLIGMYFLREEKR